MSRECRPIDGSSSTYSVSTSCEPSELASPMRWASPPESVRVRAMQREIVEPDVAEELHAVARLLENVRGDLPLELA